MTFRKALSVLIILGAAAVSGQENLLSGDADAERGPDKITGGPWSNPSVPYKAWDWDKNTGCQSRSSMRLFGFCGVGMSAVKLPPGKYTFSFYAKAAQHGTVAFITVNPQSSTWADVNKRRAAGLIYLPTEWKRFSHTFESDGETPYSPYYSLQKGEAWFDRFMLNRGDEAAPWAPSSLERIDIIFPEDDVNTYPFDRPVRVKVLLSLPGMADRSAAKPLKIEVVDHFNTRIADYSPAPRFNDRGVYDFSFKIPAGKSGWYRVRADFEGVESEVKSLVLLRPPEPRGPEPFVGLCGAERYPRAAEMLGIKWLEVDFRWDHAEAQKGVFNFGDLNHIAEWKKQGYKIKLLLSSMAPDWMHSPETAEGARKTDTYLHRLLPPAEELDTSWRAVIRQVAEKFGRDVDVFEIGGELDALIGLSAYYKSLEPDKLVGRFAAGESLRRACRQINIAAEEILKVRPDARISAVRPSDVDARHQYIYSAEIFKHTGQFLNCFGIDCYPQPRWIGPGRPPVGTEQQLADRFRDAKAVADKYCRGSDIYISEYGYFIDYDEVFNPDYLIVQANRLARSFLKARVLGMKSLFYFCAGGSGMEGNRYFMSIWWRSNPLAAAAALATVGTVVDNVVECEEIDFHRDAGVALYRKHDHSAVAALWSIRPEYRPRITFDADGLEIRDIMGNPIAPGSPLELGQEPVYLWRQAEDADNYAVLKKVLANLKSDPGPPAEITIRPASRDTVRAFVTNRSRSACAASVEYAPGKVIRFDLPSAGTAAVEFPGPAPKRSFTPVFRFGDSGQPCPVDYTVPEITVVPARSGIRIDGSLDSWRNIVPAGVDGANHIMPLDHTTYNGSNDLSARLYLAHDGRFLYAAILVRDDIHMPGDAVKLAFDPLNNYIREGKGSDPDDSVVMLSADGRAAVEQGTLEITESRTVRDEKNQTTLYQLKIPLSSIHETMKPGNCFGFNFVVPDDDTGSGADYWLFLRDGLGDGLQPDRFAQFTLE